MSEFVMFLYNSIKNFQNCIIEILMYYFKTKYSIMFLISSQHPKNNFKLPILFKHIYQLKKLFKTPKITNSLIRFHIFTNFFFLIFLKSFFCITFFTRINHSCNHNHSFVHKAASCNLHSRFDFLKEHFYGLSQTLLSCTLPSMMIVMNSWHLNRWYKFCSPLHSLDKISSFTYLLKNPYCYYILQKKNQGVIPLSFCPNLVPQIQLV